MKFVTLVWLCFATLTGHAFEPPPVLLCKPTPMSCIPIGSSDEKFDAHLQRLLAEHRLTTYALKPEALYIYLPFNVDVDVREQQIRLLSELLAQERAKSPDGLPERLPEKSTD